MEMMRTMESYSKQWKHIHQHLMGQVWSIPKTGQILLNQTFIFAMESKHRSETAALIGDFDDPCMMNEGMNEGMDEWRRWGYMSKHLDGGRSNPFRKQVRFYRIKRSFPPWNRSIDLKQQLRSPMSTMDAWRMKEWMHEEGMNEGMDEDIWASIWMGQI
jgi:hypothetical protein